MGERIEVVTRVERRRRWSVEEKLRIVEETRAPGASLLQVARRHYLNANQLYTWRRMAEGRGARPAETPRLVPVRITPSASAARGGVGGKIEIGLPGGVRLKIDEGVTSERLAQVLAILRR
jgi:transposase